jgi:hypothetical protein
MNNINQTFDSPKAVSVKVVGNILVNRKQHKQANANYSSPLYLPFLR